MIRVDPGPWKDMVEHARSTYPNECCGAMLGATENGEKIVREGVPLENAFDGSQAERYELRNEDLLARGTLLWLSRSRTGCSTTPAVSCPTPTKPPRKMKN